MRLALVLSALLLLVPLGLAQQDPPRHGRVVLSTTAIELHVNSTVNGTIRLVVDLSLECDPGEVEGIGFPTISARLSPDPGRLVALEPQSFRPEGAFERSAGQYGTNDRFTYSGEQNITVTVTNETAGQGAARLRWDVSGGSNALVSVPPECTPQGYDWELESADDVLIRYEATVPIDPDVARTRSGNGRVIGGETVDSPTIHAFTGESRTHSQALIVLSAAVLATVAIMGLYGRLRRP